MSPGELAYAVVTPVRDEAENLPRLADALVAQTARPATWLIVDNGSRDGTRELAAALADAHPWIRLVVDDPGTRLERGGPITRAFMQGVDALAAPVDVVVKLDADVSFGPDYFALLLEAFAADPVLGIASGSCWERDAEGVWRQHFGTGDTTVWGASRAYRWDCLQDVLPLEERMGWDGIDALRAARLGWSTRTLLDVPFRHHRREGERDGRRTRVAHPRQRGALHALPPDLPGRPHALPRAPRAAALAMLAGYAEAAARGEARCADVESLAIMREEQRLRALPRRFVEASGRIRTAA
ncbi:MAG: glycosyltransferase family A protein [Thermoleophilia bacterium]